ncbi:MAG TPA: segregation/condensation protein A [Actinobacteria bacterium]|nr:segregation/condensation protein A [Actinomycetota bacterium]
MSYQVKIEVFEGPFDLLLNLIMKHKLDIYDIPIAKITEEYLSYIEQMQVLDLEVASGFLLVASTLVEIKSATLIPGEEADFKESEISSDEAKQNLIARLVEYKKFKNASLGLAAKLESESRFYKREAGLEDRFLKLLPDFLEGVLLEDLVEFINNLLAKTDSVIIDTSHVIPAPISLKDVLLRMVDKFSRKRKQTFRELTVDCQNKGEIVAFFLIVLELYKGGFLKLSQAETFGEIKTEFCGAPEFELMEEVYGI